MSQADKDWDKQWRFFYNVKSNPSKKHVKKFLSDPDVFPRFKCRLVFLEYQNLDKDILLEFLFNYSQYMGTGEIDMIKKEINRQNEFPLH